MLIGIAVALLALMGLAGPANAYVIQQNTPLSFEAGSICNYPDEGKMPAPETFDGQVGIRNRPYQFVYPGDKAPALPDIAFGMIVQLKSFTPGETLTLETFRFEDMRAPDRWHHILRDDGRLWMGQSPDQGRGLPQGRYQMSVLRGAQKLFVFNFYVVPASSLPDFHADCSVAVTS